MLIDGRAIAQSIQKNLKEALLPLQSNPPKLVFIRVGDHPASISYIRMKKKQCSEVGIFSEDYELAEQTKEEELLELIKTLNNDPGVDGILVQLPLPPHIDTSRVILQIDPTKDVDGFHPVNVGKLLLGEKDGFISCTPYGIQVLMHHAAVETAGKHVVILGRSNIVGKPLAALLVQKQPDANATVTIAHSQTQNLQAICRSADILIAAIGQPHFVKKEMVREGAVVVDVGINRLDGKLMGDVDFENVAPICSKITPVPGGVGPMTIAMLLSNTLLSYQRRRA